MSVIILFCLSFLLVEYISWHFKGEKVQKNTQIVMCFLPVSYTHLDVTSLLGRNMVIRGTGKLLRGMELRESSFFY